MYIRKHTALLMSMIIVSLGFIVGWYDVMLERSKQDLRWYVVTSESHIQLLSRVESQQRETIARQRQRIYELEQLKGK
jgi:hypothetical protein